MHIYTDDQGTCWLVLHFITQVATIRECITAAWSVACNTTV